MLIAKQKTRQIDGNYHVSGCCGRLIDFVVFSVSDEDYVCRGCRKRALLGGKFVDVPKARQFLAILRELLGN